MPGASRWLEPRLSGTTMAHATNATSASSSLRIASPPSGSRGGRALVGVSLPSEVLFALTQDPDHSQEFRARNVDVTLDSSIRNDGPLRAPRAFDAGGPRPPQGGARFRGARRA